MEEKKTQEKKPIQTTHNFNKKANTTFAGYKEKKLENCTKIDDVKAYKDKYKQKDDK